MAKATKKAEVRAIQGAMAIAKHVRQLPASKLWIDFDQDADVLYISLKRPQQATDTVEADNGRVLLRYRDRELVGITVLEASKQ